MIKVENLSMLFSTEEVQTKALNEVTFEIEKGEFVAIMGPSGCGKSTLLNILGTLDTPTSGSYLFEGKRVDKMNENQLTALRKGNIGFIFQSFNLIDELTVYENVELPLVYLNIKPTERNRRVKEVLEKVNMLHRANHLPQQLMKIVVKVARTDANILITGENGTGKEMLAQEIHRLSTRKEHSMVTVDMGAISESLFESELFGHERGSFTDAYESRPGKFEAASGSSLFMDEIGNLPLAMQAKLLTVLQNRKITRIGSNKVIPVDIRLLSATNKNIQDMVDSGTFREDLLYRLNTIHLEIPPLRERREDIHLFINYFMQRYAAKYEKKEIFLHEHALEKLCSYHWPGNIRELQHTIEKAVILCEGDVIRSKDIFVKQTWSPQFSTTVPNLEEVERQAIETAIRQNDGNLTATAEQLGISRQTLYNKIKRFKL